MDTPSKVRRPMFGPRPGGKGYKVMKDREARIENLALARKVKAAKQSGEEEITEETNK